MKQSIIALFAMGFVLAAHAQTNTPAPAAAAPTPAVEPTSTTRADNTRYINDPNLLAGVQAEVNAFNAKPCDVIFIGETAMAGWRGTGSAIWNSAFAPLKALNFSVAGDKTQNVIWRLNNMDLSNLKPKVAVIQIGGSNTMNTAHEIADGVKAVVANTQAAFSGVKIILVGPIPGEDKMTAVNSLIRGNADEGMVFYVNLFPLMPMISTTNANGMVTTNWKGLEPDQVHLNATGYQILADAIAPLLKKLLAGG